MFLFSICFIKQQKKEKPVEPSESMPLPPIRTVLPKTKEAAPKTAKEEKPFTPQVSVYAPAGFQRGFRGAVFRTRDSILFAPFQIAAAWGGKELSKDKPELAAATTLVGPHRDDFKFQTISNRGKATRELSSYGSRGEQRMSVLWLKLAELAFIEAKTRERPTLLLDDIFSELDHEHRDVVMKLAEKQQTIITTADEHFVEDFGKSNKILL